MTKTIAQQLNVKEFPFEIRNKEGKQIYWENSNAIWYKKEFNERGNRIYHEDSDGYWGKWEYDERGNKIRYEDSYGFIVDNRPKEFTMDEIAKLLNIDVKNLKIKK